uniref:Rho-GAP domain-containing protein n=1 Tax=Echinostoma caproni TaxID=27848 RepID=A0A183AJX8_9TREM
LRNQGLVNQAMTVLIQHCDAIFMGDQVDETFALGDDFADSWRSATSGLNPEPLDLKAFSSSTSCSSSSVSRSFYSTLFSGRSQERLTAESTNLIPGTDPPSLLGSPQYKVVKPMMPALWTNPPSTRLIGVTTHNRESTSAPQTAPGRLRTPELRSEPNTLTLSSGSRTFSTTSTTSSGSSSSGLDTHSAGSESPKSAHSDAQISHSEPGANLMSELNFPDSSNQLALDLAHLITSFGSDNCIDFSSIPLSNEHSALLTRRMGTKNSQSNPPEPNGFHTDPSATQTNGADKLTVNLVDSPDHKPPTVIVSRPSTCGDHEPQMACLYTADYEVCMYELPAIPDSCPSNTTVTTTAPTITAFTKGVTESRTDDPSDVDLLRGFRPRPIPAPSLLSPQSKNSVVPDPIPPQSAAPAAAAGNSPAVCLPSVHLNQAISACLDAHVFACGSPKDQDAPRSPSLDHQTNLPHLATATSSRAARSQSGLAVRSGSAVQYLRAEPNSLFPTLSAAPSMSNGRLSLIPGMSVTSIEHRGSTGKHQPSQNASDSPLETCGQVCRPTFSGIVTSASTPVSRSSSSQLRSKCPFPLNGRLLTTRSVSAPMVYLASSYVKRKPFWVGSNRFAHSNSFRSGYLI